MSNYYNENDPKAAAWLRQLIATGAIPGGFVDERSILDITPTDLAGYTQCHFFAGIGGWPLALRLAGWPEDRPIWTGSCPCQPFSVAGKGMGEDDERHLWPYFRNLAGQCQPPVIAGEQVASKDGRNWLARVRADLEAMGYAAGAADLCAAGVGSPHIRQRLFWIARRLSHTESIDGRPEQQQGESTADGRSGFAGDGTNGGMAHSECYGRRTDLPWRGSERRETDGRISGMAETGTNPDGSEGSRLDQLPRVAQLAGWASPRSQTSGDTMEGHAIRQQKCKQKHGRIMGKSLEVQALSVNPSGWTTPRAEDAESAGMRHSRGIADTLSSQTGQDSSSSHAGTENRGVLAPDFVCWLQGFNIQWDIAAIVAAMKIKPKQRKKK